jgi:hypothetical protein
MESESELDVMLKMLGEACLGSSGIWVLVQAAGKERYWEINSIVDTGFAPWVWV